MDKSRIIALAREGRGFIIGRNSQERTVQLVGELIEDGRLRVVERFKDGDGVRVVPCG